MKKITKASLLANECGGLVNAAATNEKLLRRRLETALQSDALRKVGRYSGKSAEVLIRATREGSK